MSGDVDSAADDADEVALGSDTLDDSMLGAIRFAGLSPTGFEEFCFDLLSELEFVNIDWRKGTPKESSPADRGRDIVAELDRTDVDGHTFRETWFVDCKRYERGVPPDALQGTIAWAQAERPNTVLFVASGYFTNGAKDWIERYSEENKPAFRIRTWEMPQLRRLLGDHLDVAFRHDVQTETLRRVTDILAAEAEVSDRLWYGRKPPDDQIPDDWKPEIVEGMLAAKRRMEEQYGFEELMKDVENDWAWGFLSGKVSALRWVLGLDWDMLDS